MLRRFNVKNFMSFLCNKDGLSDEFSMLPGRVRNMKSHLYDDGDKGLLKFAAIYGANASGKSNLIKAITCMKEIIENNSSKGYTDKYCRIGEDNKDKPSYFEAEIFLNEKRYVYGFEVILSQSRFVSEWLVELLSENNENVIFERDIENNQFTLCKDWETDETLMNRLEIYIEELNTEETSLFLNLMNDKRKKNFFNMFSQAGILSEVYNWFSKKLVISNPNQPVGGYNYFSSNQQMENALKIIKTFGTGINDYIIENVEAEDLLNKLPNELRKKIESYIEDCRIFLSKLNVELKEKYSDDAEKSAIDEALSKTTFNISLKNKKQLLFILVKNDDIICNVIKFSHSDSNNFDFGEESDGTQRLWELLEVLLTDEEKIFFIDEIDRCMHPSLTYKFVKNFFELTENKNVQLVVTTHESRLLDFDLLRRDEIWFVEKQKNGDSEIYSLEDYNERFDRKIDKAYLEGRYGGVPVFTSLFPVEEDE